MLTLDSWSDTSQIPSDIFFSYNNGVFTLHNRRRTIKVHKSVDATAWPRSNAVAEASAFRVDYCNGLLTGLSKQTIKQLQLTQNVAARVLSRTKRTEDITTLNCLGPDHTYDVFKELTSKLSRALRSMDSRSS